MKLYAGAIMAHSSATTQCTVLVVAADNEDEATGKALRHSRKRFPEPLFSDHQAAAHEVADDMLHLDARVIALRAEREVSAGALAAARAECRAALDLAADYGQRVDLLQAECDLLAQERDAALARADHAERNLQAADAMALVDAEPVTRVERLVACACAFADARAEERRGVRLADAGRGTWVMNAAAAVRRRDELALHEAALAFGDPVPAQDAPEGGANG